MRNIFSHSQAFIEKHKQHHHFIIAVFALIIAGTSTYIWRNEIVQAATYTFTQSSWAGGADTVTTSTHASNQTGWTKYFSATGVAAGSNVQLATPTAYSFTDDRLTTTWDGSKKYSGVTLSGGDLTASGSGSVRATQGKDTGIWYWKVSGGATRTGIADASFDTSLGTNIGPGSDSVGWTNGGLVKRNGDNVATIAGYVASDTLGFLFNGDANTLSLYKNDVFQVTLTGTEMVGQPYTGVWYPAVSGGASTANFGASDLGTIPGSGVPISTSTPPTNPTGTMGGGFDYGAFSSARVTGSSTAVSVALGMGAVSGGTGADGAYSCTSGTCSLTGATYNYTTFNISSGAIVNVTGTTKLVINATGAVTIAGTLNANGGDGQDQTGGGAGGIAVAGGSNGGAGGILATAGSAGSGGGGGGGGGGGTGAGGGGGSYGNAGGIGDATGGGAAGTYSATDSESMGGGGGGNGNNSYLSGGGASGGNIKIQSAGTITVSGAIYANGGTTPNQNQGGGGGGSGGRIYLIANEVLHSGTLGANGGAGGPNTINGIKGGAGGSGRVYVYGNKVTIGSTGGVLEGAGLLSPATYASSGTFTSAVIDLGGPSSLTTLDFTATLSSQTITMEARAGNTTNTSDSSWTSWTTGISSGGSISALAGNRYVQYRATLSTSNTAVTPTLNSVTINYTRYGTSGSFISSKYDSGDAANLISKITWTGSGTTSAQILKFQVRSSPDGTTWSNWCGSSVTCGGTDYFLDANNGVALSSSHPLRSGANDRYLQYQAFLSSGGGGTPTLSSVVVTYVVNAAPSFDTAYGGGTGIVVSQITDSASADWGKVTISYKVRDIDTTTGSNTPANDVTPSFEYNTGSGWVALTTNLAAGDTSNKLVDEITYNTYTATWAATTTVPSVYTASAQVRVTINDNEAANNTTTATSTAFTLDTTAPAVGTSNATLDSSTGGATLGTVVLSATDNSTLQYRFCNDNAFPSNDSQGNSCAWSTLGASPVASTNASWVTTGSPSIETVYVQVRDLYGNAMARTIVAPAFPASFTYSDISNASTGSYREFLSWATFVATTSSAFASYKLYHSIDGTSYSTLATITDPAINYYTHNITTATSSTQYYKLTAVNTSGNTSNYTAVLTDVADGSGGLDTTAPYIPPAGIATPTVGNSSANITFSTYTDSSMTSGELATSTIRYASYTGSVPSSCPSTPSESTATYTVNHSIYLTGLTPATQYYYCIIARDISGNVSTATTAIGGTFTTVSGPIITNVTERELTDTSALIFWNTNTSSDSKVYYSTTASGVNSATPIAGAVVTTAGSDGTYQHQVGLTGLTTGTTYYYKVSSTDTATTSLTTVNNNNGQYYSFVTLKDTSPPIISATSTPVLAPTSAVVVWQTNEPASTKVEYGTTSSYGTTSEDSSDPLSIYHVRALTLLTKETLYYYRVTSKDAANNQATSVGTFTTPADGNVSITVVRTASTNAEVKDTTAPLISNVVVSDITPFSAVVNFDTDEDTVAFAKYGKDATYGDTGGDDTWAKRHTLKLRGLTLGTEYRVKASASDKAGNIGTANEATFKTNFLSENLKDLANVDNIEQFQKEIENAIESILPSLVPPFVSKPIVTEVTESGAKISFKTNIKAFPVVVYAEDSAYDETKENPYIGEVSDTALKASSHELSLTGLKGNTKYHIQARAFSLPRVIGKSADVTFITKASKIAGSIVERKKDSFTVVWTTEEPTTSVVEYKDLKRGVTQRKTDDAKKRSHSMKIENLPPGVTYEVNLSGMTEQGNIAEAGSPLSVTTSRDVTEPIISGFKVDNALVPGRTDRIQTIVSWTTDEASNSTVYYEEGAGTVNDTAELANKNVELDSYIVNHSIILPNLKPGTIYRLKVVSSDDSGNVATFGPRTVITPRQTESITDIIFKNFEDSFKFLQKI